MACRLFHANLSSELMSMLKWHCGISIKKGSQRQCTYKRGDEMATIFVRRQFTKILFGFHIYDVSYS